MTSWGAGGTSQDRQEKMDQTTEIDDIFFSVTLQIGIKHLIVFLPHLIVFYYIVFWYSQLGIGMSGFVSVMTLAIKVRHIPTVTNLITDWS